MPPPLSTQEPVAALRANVPPARSRVVVRLMVPPVRLISPIFARVKKAAADESKLSIPEFRVMVPVLLQSPPRVNVALAPTLMWPLLFQLAVVMLRRPPLVAWADPLFW